MKYISEINKKYITDFKNKIRERFSLSSRNTYVSFTRVLYDELSTLLRIIFGKMSSKHDIPIDSSFPDSAKYNRMVDNICIDVDKVYNAQTLINDDVQNLLNLNSLGREKLLAGLSSVQSIVYTSNIKAGSSVDGYHIIKEDFIDNRLTADSTDVEINPIRESLILKTSKQNIDRESVDFNLVNCYPIDVIKDAINIYPSNKSMAIGSFWNKKKDRGDIHFTYKKDMSEYRRMMVDDEGPNSVGSVQFEMVGTFEKMHRTDISRASIERKASKAMNIDPSFIMIDKINSMNSKYISHRFRSELINPKIKISIPFLNAKQSNGFVINFDTNDSNKLPSILFDESFVYDHNGTKVKLVSPSDDKINNYSKTGIFNIYFSTGLLKPTRIELVVKYASSAWTDISYWMSCYAVSVINPLTITTNDNAVITSSISSRFFILVDEEIDTKNEKNRAMSVFQNKEVK